MEPIQETLKKRQKELCGNYFADPSGLLDRAWKKYEISLSSGNTDAAQLLEAFNQLDQERKSIDAKLSAIALQIKIPAAPHRTVEILAQESIQKQIEALEIEKKNESSLSGVDWRKTAETAGKLALLSFGYMAIQTM